MNTIEKEKSYRCISIGDVTCFFVLIYFLWWSMEIIINNFTSNFQNDYLSLVKLLLLGLISQVGINIVPSFILCKLKKLNIKELFKLKHVSMEQFIMSLILFLSFNGIALFLDNFMNIILSRFGLSYKMNNYIVAKDISTLVVLILIAGILTPLCEELFYRGFLISSIEKSGVKFSIVFSAVCFSIMHTNPYRLSSLFIYSIFMGIIVYYTNSTLPGIILHILNNTAYEIGSYFTRGDLVTTSFISENKNGTSLLSRTLIIYGILFLICSVISYIAIKRLKNIWEINNGLPVERDIVEIKGPSQKIKICISMIVLASLFAFKVSLYF